VARGVHHSDHLIGPDDFSLHGPMTNRRRMVTAALTAPPVGTALAFVSIVVLLDLARDLGPRGIARLFGDFMVYGSAVAYLVGAAFGIPAYLILRRRHRLGFRWVVLVGAVGGVLALLPVLAGFTGSPGALGGTAALGAVSGACAGAWFWLVAFGRRSPYAGDRPT
jgi:hypothetical protein